METNKNLNLDDVIEKIAEEVEIVKNKQNIKKINKEKKTIIYIFLITLALSIFIILVYLLWYKTNKKLLTLQNKYHCNILIQNKIKDNIINQPNICYINNKTKEKIYNKNFWIVWKSLLEKMIKNNWTIIQLYNKSYKNIIRKVLLFNIIKELYNNPKTKNKIDKYNKERGKMLKKINNSKTLTKIFYKNPFDFTYFMKLYLIYNYKKNANINKVLFDLNQSIIFKKWNYYFQYYKLKNKELNKIQNENLLLFKQLLKNKDYKKYLILLNKKKSSNDKINLSSKK